MVQTKHLVLALAVLAVASLLATPAVAENRKLLQLYDPADFADLDEELRDYLSDRAVDLQPFDFPGRNVPIFGGFLETFWEGLLTAPVSLAANAFGPAVYTAAG